MYTHKTNNTTIKVSESSHHPVHGAEAGAELKWSLSSWVPTRRLPLEADRKLGRKSTSMGTTAFGEGSVNPERSRRVETDKAEGGVPETAPRAECMSVCTWADSQ